MDQPGRGGLETAGAVGERREVLLEVNVEPFTSCCFGVRCCPAGESGGYPLPLMPARGLRIQEESVIAAVPRDVDEADKCSVAQPGRHPAQAVRPDLVHHLGTACPPCDLTSSVISVSVIAPRQRYSTRAVIPPPCLPETTGMDRPWHARLDGVRVLTGPWLPARGRAGPRGGAPAPARGVGGRAAWISECASSGWRLGEPWCGYGLTQLSVWLFGSLLLIVRAGWSTR